MMEIKFDRETVEKARKAYLENSECRRLPFVDSPGWQFLTTVFADAANAQLQSAPEISVEELARELSDAWSNDNSKDHLFTVIARRAIDLLGPGARLQTEAKESVQLSTDAAGESPAQENAVQQMCVKEIELSLAGETSLRKRLAKELQETIGRAEAAEAERDKLRERLEKIRRILEMVVQNQHASFRPDTVSFAKELVGQFWYSVVPEQHTPARVVKVGDGEIPSKFLMPGSVAELNARGSVQL